MLANLIISSQFNRIYMKFTDTRLFAFIAHTLPLTESLKNKLASFFNNINYNQCILFRHNVRMHSIGGGVAHLKCKASVPHNFLIFLIGRHPDFLTLFRVE